MEPFSKFGFEPTFFPKINIPGAFYEKINDCSYWEQVYEAYYSMLSHTVEKEVGPKFRWYSDGGNLELPTRSCYTDYAEFKKDYKDLLSTLKKHQLYPSSSLCLQSEGGCHINFDLRWMLEERRESFLHRFISNYRNYVLSNPSIVWMFISPYDNQSSALVYREYIPSFYKGDFYTIRNYSKDEVAEDTDAPPLLETCITKDGSSVETESPNRRADCRGTRNECAEGATEQTTQMVDQDPYIPIAAVNSPIISNVEYIELRHFMMPRNDKEFDLHFDFANALLHFILDRTELGSEFPFINKPIKEYTYERAREEFMIVCRALEFPYSRVREVGKLELLKKRFTFGKDYLM